MGLSDLRDLPYPWDTLADVTALARSHPDGLVDLSIGTPVDPTPPVVRAALEAASDAHAYPLTYGTAPLREAVAAWFARRRGVPDLDPAGVLPTIGSKELVGLLPSLLRLGAGDVVVHPAVAYPTYDVGARLAGATALATDDVADWAGNPDVRLVWVNTPSNPTGAVADVAALRRVVEAARATGAVVVSDECYALLPWEPGLRIPSLLDPEVTGGDRTGLLVAYSLSKQSNLAGYRAAFLAGDPALVADLLATRKHLGMIVPRPVQEAMRVALGDDAHVDAQRAVYGRRREVLRGALEAAGWAVDHSEAGLYLWVRPADSSDVATSRELVARLAALGILAGPGEFYGAAGAGHVRVALTAPDEAIAVAAARLRAAGPLGV
ncbi:aminotransferase class I and II [Xylanimonas cellulosilytica DSM 15894]|uniref:Aminotransferase n=1 Tax=Xylanimonas cellulosilytica (strain DSM 15894 / JCM 12276 / CECT 5975 / KCTC 9989 / LMG 20990 / NBRC 107835 / XIL07) TaxID=446471 RepID=D1BYS7_XYLCX|nr:succinyldiaminopimelate transaminase [Xylanimonas cellulosilytica]ACZ30002.1 aminotransferase class I and II [Xylanimonas cellulosilytica DSM 15894]